MKKTKLITLLSIVLLSAHAAQAKDIHLIHCSTEDGVGYQVIKHAGFGSNGNLTLRVIAGTRAHDLDVREYPMPKSDLKTPEIGIFMNQAEVNVKKVKSGITYAARGVNLYAFYDKSEALLGVAVGDPQLLSLPESCK